MRSESQKSKISKSANIPEYLLPYIQSMTDPDDCSPIDPPGCYSAYIDTPYPVYRDGRKGAIEVGVFYEHRFAFYYWMKWRRKRCLDNKEKLHSFEAPHLVTMDRHNDFGCECDFLEEHLIELNKTTNLGEVALFTWAGLRSLNDGHILPAVWLNTIGDVYLITKQVGQKEEIQCVKDCFGNSHNIHYVKSLEEFARRWERSDCTRPERDIYWDIDLDFFTKGNLKNGPIMSEKEIRKVFETDKEGLHIILNAISGLTFALEPEYSRGLSTALKFYTIWEKIFLKGNISPFGNYGWRSKYSQK